MRKSRALRLSKETLTRLGTEQLAAINGAVSTLPCLLPAFSPTLQFDCINDITFEWCPEPITLPLEHCL